MKQPVANQTEPETTKLNICPPLEVSQDVIGKEGWRLSSQPGQKMPGLAAFNKRMAV
jgi:hypothetical protein